MVPLTTIRKVSIPVLWDAQNNFKGGELFSVTVDSVIGDTVLKPSEQNIPGYPIEDYTSTLEIKDPTIGALYTTLTLSQYMLLIGSGANLPENTLSILYIGGDNTGTGSIVTILAGIEIVSISKSGPVIYGAVYTIDGLLDLTAEGGLALGEPMQVIYKIPS